MRLCFKSESYNRIQRLFLQPQPFFKKAAIIIATLGQETLQQQLNKVISSSMHDCNFETVNQVLNERIEKVEMQYTPFIYTVIIYLMFWIRFREEPVMLATFALETYVRNVCSRLSQLSQFLDTTAICNTNTTFFL